MSRRPRELSSVLGDLQDRLAPRDLLAQVQREWRSVVGDELAAEAWPEAEHAGIVTARCRSAVWAAELTMLAAELEHRLNERLSGSRQVLALKFTAAPLRGRAGGASDR
jgi:predicted nucleic acid-binding Zn ribbon protein